jgi:hypothetical protein
LEGQAPEQIGVSVRRGPEEKAVTEEEVVKAAAAAVVGRGIVLRPGLIEPSPKLVSLAVLPMLNRLAWTDSADLEAV